MDAFLIVVHRIQPGELRSLHEYLQTQFTKSPDQACVYVLEERSIEPHQDTPSDYYMNFDMVAGHGDISSFVRSIRIGSLRPGIIIWIPCVPFLVESFPDFHALIHELRENDDIAIGVRESIQIFQKMVGKVIFPDLRDPYSDRFLIKPLCMLRLDITHVHGPILPHILSQLKPGSIKEFSWRIPGEFSSVNRQSIVPQVIGIIQILKRMTECRDSVVGKELNILIKFALVGFSGIIMNTGLLFLFTEYAHIYYIISSAFAIETSILTNFILNERWTFVNRECSIQSWWQRLFSYNLLAIGGMVVNMGILFLLTEYVGMYYLLANIIGIITAFTWNYVSNRNITWK